MQPLDCTNEMPAACPLHFEPLTLAEALARFRGEARPGVCDTGRYRCPFYLWGDGPTLVCVTGLADDARSFVPLLAHLSRHFRCVAYDWPTGEGDAARPASYRHEDFVADFFALLDHVGARQAYPLGYSFGSTVVLAALARQPARLPRAVLLSGFARRRLAPAEVLLASLARWWPGPLRRLPLRLALLQASQQAGFARCEPAMWEYFLERNGGLPMRPMAWRALIVNRLDLRSLLPGIHQPVLLVCGDADPVVYKPCETDLLMGLPNVARVELTRCGHMSIFTHPETLADLVVEFLAGAGAQLFMHSVPA
jgi:pimeloyl-ACP methyl ester carboxylesterase